ncbi:metal ABC transporter permease [Patescibacteria group bacterium]
MIDILREMLTEPFMQRALITGAFVGVLLAVLGVFVLIKRMAFFGDGVAHASLAGIAIGLLAGIEPLLIAMLFAIGIALAMYALEKRSSLSTDAVIGIFFTSSLALGVLLLSWQSSYQPDLMSFLFGNILAVTRVDAIMIILVATGLLITIALLSRKLSLLVIDQEQAKLQGIRDQALMIFLYIALAVAIVLGVKLVGVILVSALLIIPAAGAKLWVRSFAGLRRTSVILALVMVIAGLILSYVLDLPSGAVIVIVGFGLFLLSLVASLARQRS